MKNFLKLTLVIMAMAVFFSCIVFAETSGDFTYTVNDDGISVTIKRYTGKSTDVVIPSTIDGYTVTEIYGEAWGFDNAFYNCTSIVSITLPETLTTIGAHAFRGCTSLESIHIPASVTSVDNFYDCTSLKTITVDENNTVFSSVDGILYDFDKTTLIKIPDGYSEAVQLPSTLKKIEYLSIDNCINVTSLTVDAANESFCSVGNMILTADEKTILYAAKGIELANIPDSVTKINNEAFANSSKLKNVNFTSNNKLVEIGNSSFGHCVSLESINLEACVNLKILGPYAFTYCSALKEISIPNTITEIYDHTFYRCSSLETVSLPSKLVSIRTCAFQECWNLTNIEFPDTLQIIESTAFWGGKMKEIFIPKSVISIGDNPFHYCEAESITVDEENEIFTSVDGILYDKNVTTLLRAPCGIKGDIILPDGVKAIAQEAFFECDSLESLEISASVERIEEDAFWSATNIQRITFAKNSQLKYIGDGAFTECRGVNNLILPEGLTTIDDNAFSTMIYIDSITLPKSVTSIGTKALWNNSQLEAIYLYRNSYADEYCLADDELAPLIVYLDEENIEVDGLIFTLSDDGKYYILSSVGNCKNRYIVVPHRYKGLPVKVIGENAFENCSTVVTIILPWTIKTIENNAFKGASNLSAVIPLWGASITKIGNSAFENCKRLIYFTVPYGTEVIGSYAFSGCTALRRIDIYDNIDTMGDDIFYGCSNLKSIYVFKNSIAASYCLADNKLAPYVKYFKTLHSENISISGKEDRGLPNDYELSTGNLNDDEIKKEHGDHFKGNEKIEAHDITLHKNGKKVQPNSDVTVEIDVPTGYDGNHCKIYREDDDGELIEMDVEHYNGKLRFNTNHFSTYIIVEDLPKSDFLSFDGFQIRKDDYNGLRSRFTVDFEKLASLNDQGYTIVEYGTLLASTDKLISNSDELIAFRDENGSCKTLDYGIIYPIFKNGAFVGKYIDKNDKTLSFACTVINYTEDNFDKNISVRGYAVIKDEYGNEYITYSDYPNEKYRAISLENLCDELASLGLISEESNISYADVIKFRKKRDEPGWEEIYQP